MKYKLLGILSGCIGLLMIIMAVSEPDFTIGGRIFSILCGLLFLIFMPICRGLYASKAQADKLRVEAQKMAQMKEAAGGMDVLAEQFRQDYRSFYQAAGTPENSALQQASTQLFWNICRLRKNRLDRKGLTLDFSSSLKLFRDVPPIVQSRFFDGKYDITNVQESTAVEISFQRNGSVLHTIKKDRMACYVVTSAKHTDKKHIICPGCGAESSLENLLDGCDYCGTRFRIGDLKEKVSAFYLDDNYQIQYAQYKEGRKQYTKRVYWGQFWVYFVLFVLVYVIGFLTGGIELDANLSETILTLPLASAMAAAMFAYLGICFFWLFLFPLIHVGKAARFYTKKKLRAMKYQVEKDSESEKKIRQHDPQFSIANFYSGIWNKLAIYFFAETSQAANAFFEQDHGELPLEPDAVDLELNSIDVVDYRVEEGLQRIQVEAVVNLLLEKDGQFRKASKMLRMEMVKNQDCLTQEICAPFVLRCKGCGSTIALENGKTCSHCGRTLDLKPYDWVIREFQILGEKQQTGS